MAQASAASVPAYLLPGVQVIQPPNLEGDATLATEILPGPPSITSIRQPKKIDARKPHTIPLSYLPLSDPGTTYTGLAGGIMPLQDTGSRRKRARVDRGYVSPLFVVLSVVVDRLIHSAVSLPPFISNFLGALLYFIYVAHLTSHFAHAM